MKLFDKFNRANLIATISIFLLSSIAFYFLLRYVLVSQVDDSLEIEQQEVEAYVKTYHRLPEPVSVNDQEILFTPSDAPFKKRKIISATLRTERHDEPCRQLTFSINIDQQWYLVTVRNSLEDTDAMTHTIILITLITIGVVLISGQVINRIVLRRLWKPFYQSLDIINNFTISKDAALQLPDSEIDEFTTMNKTLSASIGKAQKDYALLKEFTSNAAHELQTPLAIIRSQLELLIQDAALSEAQSKAVQSADEALDRLARTNKSLLLLTKIENQQYAEKLVVHLREKIVEKLSQVISLYEAKQILVSTEMEETEILMNTDLVDILLNNLLGNAFRHSNDGGRLYIFLDKNSLVVSNDGELSLSLQEGLFTRFYKPSNATGGSALGLSIIRQICDVSGFIVGYRFEAGKHVFSINFTGK
ncbi:MAG: HAMP domain-containing sensor histidine kinase [Chitinophagaceae bacterium]